MAMESVPLRQSAISDTEWKTALSGHVDQWAGLNPHPCILKRSGMERPKLPGTPRATACAVDISSAGKDVPVAGFRPEASFG